MNTPRCHEGMHYYQTPTAPPRALNQNPKVRNILPAPTTRQRNRDTKELSLALWPLGEVEFMHRHHADQYLPIKAITILLSAKRPRTSYVNVTSYYIYKDTQLHCGC